MPATAARTDKIDIRLSPDAKRTLHTAAAASHRSVSQFMLEAALARAAETLADRERFELSPERWQAFRTALDAPPRDLPRLRRLMTEASTFEKSQAE